MEGRKEGTCELLVSKLNLINNDTQNLNLNQFSYRVNDRNWIRNYPVVNTFVLFHSKVNLVNINLIWLSLASRGTLHLFAKNKTVMTQFDK